MISYAVAKRTREIGVRMALDATRRDVVSLAIWQSGRLVVTGIALGILVAFAAVGMLDSLLYGIPSRDVATFAFVPAFLAAVVLGAAFIPARRATRVDPLSR